MSRPVRLVAVFDVGKTNAKLAVVELGTGRELAVLKMANRAVQGAPYPHHDVGRLRDFLLAGLRELAASHPVEAICVTTHGATAALVDGAGGLVLPVMDYEFAGPDELRADYERLRPAFAASGSPALPIGLNLGAQLHYQQVRHPAGFARTRHILTWPQYWSMQLTGVMASEATSLGCHTDLWDPYRGDFSTLVDAMGWRSLFPPLRRAADILGPLRPDLARTIGLPATIPVHCGIHDSNASLLPHLAGRNPPFCVVSTGTWVVSMAIGGDPAALDPARDTLVNVNAFGDAVPSARFMGGREFEILLPGGMPDVEAHDVARFLSEPSYLLPSVQNGSGPFAARAAQWIGGEPHGTTRAIAASFYLALMTDACMRLIGARGPVIVEGPFARNRLFGAMLAAACGRPVIARSTEITGTSAGAALLAGDGPPVRGEAEDTIHPVPTHAAYADAWRRQLAAAGPG